MFRDPKFNTNWNVFFTIFLRKYFVFTVYVKLLRKLSKQINTPQGNFI